MDIDSLYKPGPPAFYITTIEVPDFDALSWRLAVAHKQTAIRMIRGKKGRTLDALYDEVSAALQFPWYFGGNWAAFDECITDLDWIPADTYCLMISQADLLLCDEPVEFSVLMRVLDSANVNWLTPNKYAPRHRPATAFHVIFQCDPTGLDAFSERLAQAGVRPEHL